MGGAYYQDLGENGRYYKSAHCIHHYMGELWCVCCWEMREREDWPGCWKIGPVNLWIMAALNALSLEEPFYAYLETICQSQWLLSRYLLCWKGTSCFIVTQYIYKMATPFKRQFIVKQYQNMSQLNDMSSSPHQSSRATVNIQLNIQLLIAYIE